MPNPTISHGKLRPEGGEEDEDDEEEEVEARIASEAGLLRGRRCSSAGEVVVPPSEVGGVLHNLCNLSHGCLCICNCCCIIIIVLRISKTLDITITRTSHQFPMPRLACWELPASPLSNELLQLLFRAGRHGGGLESSGSWKSSY